MWKELIFTFALLELVFGATLYHCQEGSTCQLPGDHLETTTFDFLSKFTHKQYRTIVSLTMSNASVNKIDPKLKYLKNLQYLDLSYNNIQITSIPQLTNLKTLKLNGNSLKYINLTALPQNIETLDISHNLLVNIPKDWRSLRLLKTLHLYKNPVDCDCNNVLNYDRLVKSGILVPEPLTCHSPKKYAGKYISAVNCSLDDIMLYDEPYQGSGDIFEEDRTENPVNIPFVQEEEDTDAQENNTFIDDQLGGREFLDASTPQSPFDPVLEEGSGDVGSGVFPSMGKVMGCIEDCSTPGSVGANDEEYASPLPSIVVQAKMLMEDVFQKETSTTTTQSTVTTSTTTTTTTTVAPIVTREPITEPQLVKKVELKVDKAPDKTDVEVVEDTKTGELERAQASPKNSTAIYAIIGVGLFLVVIFIICFIKKRQAKKRNNNRREMPNSLGEEMKPLSKPSVNSTNEKPIKNSSNIPEHIPLINGQNGKPKDDVPVLKSFAPLSNSDTVHEEEEEEEPEQQNTQNDQIPEEVEIRQKPIPELLTPQRERVTIKETEIPDSVLKTPLLVHRQRNSDGEIVTTLVS